MITIGSKKIDTHIFLAPLAGCSDLPFRLIAREHGARFAFYEMIDANSVVHAHKKTFHMLKTTPADAPIAGQLIGSRPELMLDAAKNLLDIVKIEFLDINAACPVKKAIQKKAGAYFMKEPGGLYKLLENLVPNIPVPVTVKMRVGYDAAAPGLAAEIAKNCESSGASAIFIHGRTKKQMYSGDVEYAEIRSVKEAVKIPVIASGNILSPELAKKMFDETHCDGILVARGSFGNPWLFKAIDAYLKDGSVPPKPDLAEIKAVLKKHLAYVDEFRHRKTSPVIGVMRKVAMWYMKGFPKAAQVRSHICAAESYETLLAVIDGTSTDEESVSTGV